MSEQEMEKAWVAFEEHWDVQGFKLPTVRHGFEAGWNARASQWIPVSERLPDVQGECLVQCDNGITRVARYQTAKFYFPYFEKRSDSVIAWQKLPEPFNPEPINRAEDK